jgi:hypothetical protein
MGDLVSWLRSACALFKLEFTENYTLNLLNGHRVMALAAITGYGQGEQFTILIFDNYAQIENCADLIVDAGFWYSVMGNYSEDEPCDINEMSDLFLDWGFDL